MHHLSFGREEEGGLGTKIPYFEPMFESFTDLFSMLSRVEVVAF
jgi:hypothetical protein